MAVRTSIAVAVVMLTIAWATAADGPHAEELDLDDECLAAGNDSACALNALQRRGLTRADLDRLGENASEGREPHYGCAGCMSRNSAPQEWHRSGIHHYAQNCWRRCGHKSGYCTWCGEGSACCRYRATRDPPECSNVGFWPVLSYHTCVTPRVVVTTTTAAPAEEVITAKVGELYEPKNTVLALPSEAPLLTFYMYRAMGDTDYAPENVNTANLAGIMWYLHNEVVTMTPRKFGVTRIVRMKVQAKAPTPLYRAGMNFGVRFAFDSGKCTGPWNCSEQFDHYGYFIGCNYVTDFPTTMWAKKSKYEGAVWYSLPGPCSDRWYNKHNNFCVATSPGGACPGTPTGRGNCTYTAEVDGDIRIDQLEGIWNYKHFITMGGREYMEKYDMGRGMSFWDGKLDPAKNAARVAAAEALFVKKYGAPKHFHEPKCDFYRESFYSNSPPDEVNLTAAMGLDDIVEAAGSTSTEDDAPISKTDAASSSISEPDARGSDVDA